MGDVIAGHAHGRELNKQAQAQEPDQRENLRSTLMAATGITYVLEDTPPSPPAPPWRRAKTRPWKERLEV
jgi:hypothetical protein